MLYHPDCTGPIRQYDLDYIPGTRYTKIGNRSSLKGLFDDEVLIGDLSWGVHKVMGGGGLCPTLNAGRSADRSVTPVYSHCGCKTLGFRLRFRFMYSSALLIDKNGYTNFAVKGRKPLATKCNA